MAKAVTFEMFQSRVNAKFPYSGLEVVDFRGMSYPVRIKCPKHGIQIISCASKIATSKHGCPACGGKAAPISLTEVRNRSCTPSKSNRQHLQNLVSLIKSDAPISELKTYVSEHKL